MIIVFLLLINGCAGENKKCFDILRFDAFVVGISFLPSLKKYFRGKRIYPHQGNGKIISGSKATIDQFPFIVSLLYIGELYTANLICSGTIIHPFKVLTTAFCIEKLMSYEIGSVVVRSNTETWNCHCHRSRTHTIAGCIPHENFKSQSTTDKDVILHYNDIGIVIVYEEFLGMFSTVLPYNKNADYWHHWEHQYESNTTAVIGWGDTFGTIRLSPQLRQAYVDIYSPQECREAYTCSESIKRLFYCAFSKRYGGRTSYRRGRSSVIGPCVYDEGGPHIANENGKWLFIGIVSTPTACQPNVPSSWDFPSTFTNLSLYTNWIDMNINSDSDPNGWDS